MRFMLVLVLLASVMVGCAAPSGTAPVPGQGAGGSGSAAAGSVPIGVWTSILTADDLRGAGFTEAGLIAENTGTFTLTIAGDGTWTVAQEAAEPVRWPVFRGTWTATSTDTLTMRTEFPTDYSGDTVTVSWSSGPEGLNTRVLSPPDPLLRLQWERHPWARSP